MPKSLFPQADAETRARIEAREMVRRLNSYDWASHPMGTMDTWNPGLKGAVRVMIAAEVPMVILVGYEGYLIYNDAYALFAGERHPSIFALPAQEAWPEIAEFNRHKIDLAMAGDTLTLMDQELVLNRHGTMESSWLNLNYSPVLGEDGHPLAVLVIVQETTDRVLAERALFRSEERLSLALNSSALVGTWDWDIVNDRVTADDRFASLFGVDPLHAGIGVPSGAFRSAIHPEDVQRVDAALKHSVAELSDFNEEYRLLQPDGAIRWVIATGRPRADGSGTAVRFPGIVMDVTEQKRQASALAESEARFRTLADAMPQMVWGTSPQGELDYFNARWFEFTGMDPADPASADWLALVHPDDRERARTTWRLSLAGEEPYRIEYRLRHYDGNYRWVLAQAVPMHGPDGAVARWFGTCTDIHLSRIAAEEREVVAQELSHRVKNTFSVISGIVSMAARAHPEIKPFADDLRGRIVALGQAHDFVRPHAKSANTLERQTSLQALIRVLIQPYERMGRSRFVITGPDAEIDDGAATPLALLFHELATNAVKYGALSADEGLVTMSAERTEADYRLTWKETGGETGPGAHQSQGFGSRLISLSVEGQLSGRLERHWDDDGLRIEMTIPLKSLSRQAGLAF